jgi:dienelactone hydrolase
VLISHGKPPTQAEMAAVHATNYRTIGHDFARRGWLAVAVVRRGYGLSEGVFQSAGNCRNGFDLMSQFRAEAADLAATLEVVGQRKDADASRILALGVSNGGVASLALAATRPAGLKGIVNISGGLRNRDCPFEDQLVSTFRTMGAQARVPSLWLYAENDSYFPPPFASRLKNAFAEGGTPVSFVMLPPVADEGHRLFSQTDGRIKWWPEVDRFLREQKLPTWPAELVDQLMLRNQLDPRHRPAVERYVSAPGEKALVKGASGATVHWWAGVETAEEASRRAIASCVEKRSMPCQLVLRNVDAPSPVASAGQARAAGSEKKTP